MRFIIVTMGTEGDIRPYIALARELRTDDHEVSIATSKNHAKVVGDFAFPCFYIAEKLGIPSFGAFMQPHHPTTEFPDPSITVGKPMGGILNLAGFWLFDLLHWQYVRKSVNRFRRTLLQLPEIPARKTILQQLKERGSYIIYAYSACFLPRPSDWRSDRLHVTGYWYLDTLKDDYCPPDRLPPGRP